MTSHQLVENTNLVKLAEALCGKPIDEVVGRDSLLTGLDIEVGRLGGRKYLVLLTQKVYDIDGLTDYVYLLESFERPADAVDYIEKAVQSLYSSQTGSPDEYGDEWHLESEGEIPFLTAPKSNHWANPIRVLYDRTYKLRAGPYDTKYNCFRVIGPFQGEIVSERLFSFVNDSFELQWYFEGAGGAGYQKKLLDALRSDLSDHSCSTDSHSPKI